MKNILVAITSTNHTNNCLAYAHYLSSATHAHLWILYVYRPVPFYPWLPKDSYEAVSQLHLKDAQKKFNVLSTRFNRLKHPSFTCLFAESPFLEELTKISSRQHIDLLILNRLEINVLLEGVESDTEQRHLLFPLLVIPKQASFHPVQEFIFVADFPETFPLSKFNLQLFIPCILLATACKAFLHILYQQARADKLRYLEEQLQEHLLLAEVNYRFVHYSLAAETAHIFSDLPMLVNGHPFFLVIKHYTDLSRNMLTPLTNRLRPKESNWNAEMIPKNAPVLILS